MTKQICKGPEPGQTRSTPRKIGAAELEKRQHQFQQAIKWLSQNKQQYGGQWIALQGSRLLATGITEKEVYPQIQKGEQPPPLVIKIEQNELPFAGW